MADTCEVLDCGGEGRVHLQRGNRVVAMICVPHASVLGDPGSFAAGTFTDRVMLLRPAPCDWLIIEPLDGPPILAPAGAHVRALAHAKRMLTP